MLQVARLAPRLLDDAADSVRVLLEQQYNDVGGARNLAG